MAEMRADILVVVGAGDAPEVRSEGDDVLLKPSPEVTIAIDRQEASAWFSAVAEGFARL